MLGSQCASDFLQCQIGLFRDQSEHHLAVVQQTASGESQRSGRVPGQTC
jgi:hypothetical protein